MSYFAVGEQTYIYKRAEYHRGNPMATSIEFQAFQKLYSDLASSIRNPSQLAKGLFARHLITATTEDRVQTALGISVYDKATILLSEVKDRIIQDPRNLQKFCSALKQESSTRSLADNIEKCYRKLY